MAGLEEALPGLIYGAPAVAAWIDDRVIWGAVPEGWPVPFVRLSWVGGLRDRHLGGFSGLRDSRVQVDSFAGGVHTNAVQLARAIEDHLLPFAGETGGIELQGVFELGRRDQSPFKIGDTWRFRVTSEFRFAWALAA